MKNFLLTICIIVGFTMTTKASFDIYSDIEAAFKSGSSNAIANYFGTTVDLTILSQEDVYSKAQAEIILKNFFAKNTPKTFTILHKGTSKEGAMYGIGSLQTNQGLSFRACFYLKQTNGKFVIQELRFEKQ